MRVVFKTYISLAISTKNQMLAKRNYMIKMVPTAYRVETQLRSQLILYGLTFSAPIAFLWLATTRFLGTVDRGA